MSDPRVAVIIPTFEGCEVVLASLPSVLDLRYENFDVFVVDGGSEDSTGHAITKEFPQIRVLRAGTHLGVASGFNVGLREVLNGTWKLALLLQQDVEPDPWMLKELVSAAAAKPGCAAVGPKIHDYWDRGRVLTAGGRVSFGLSPVQWLGSDRDDGTLPDQDTVVECLSSAAMLISVEALARVRLMDPQFRHFEDVDWCLRARRQELTCLLAAKAACWRIASNRIPEKPAFAREQGRSAARLVRRHGTRGSRARFLLNTLVALLPSALFALASSRMPLAQSLGSLGGSLGPLRPPPGAK